MSGNLLYRNCGILSLWYQGSELELNDWLFYLEPILVHKMNFVLFLTKNNIIQTTTYICPCNISKTMAILQKVPSCNNRMNWRLQNRQHLNKFIICKSDCYASDKTHWIIFFYMCVEKLCMFFVFVFVLQLMPRYVILGVFTCFFPKEPYFVTFI